MSRFKRAMYACLLLSGCAGLSACGGQPQLIDSADLAYQKVQYPGASYTEMVQVNDAGQVLGLFKDISYFGPWTPFIYDINTGTYSIVGEPNSAFDQQLLIDNSERSGGMTINDKGQILFGGAAPDNGRLYDMNTNELVVIDPPIDYAFTQFSSINNNGRIVGSHIHEDYLSSWIRKGFIYNIQEKSYQFPTYPGSRNTVFFAINDADVVLAKIYTNLDYTGIDTRPEDVFLALYDIAKDEFTALDIGEDVSSWAPTDLTNAGVLIATERSCKGASVGKCGVTVHQYDTANEQYNSYQSSYYISGKTNEALDLAGTSRWIFANSPLENLSNTTGLTATIKD